MQVNITSFSKKRQGVFIRAGAFIRINMVFSFTADPNLEALCCLQKEIGCHKIYKGA